MGPSNHEAVSLLPENQMKIDNYGQLPRSIQQPSPQFYNGQNDYRPQVMQSAPPNMSMQDESPDLFIDNIRAKLDMLEQI